MGEARNAAEVITLPVPHIPQGLKEPPVRHFMTAEVVDRDYLGRTEQGEEDELSARVSCALTEDEMRLIQQIVNWEGFGYRCHVSWGVRHAVREWMYYCTDAMRRNGMSGPYSLMSQIWERKQSAAVVQAQLDLAEVVEVYAQEFQVYLGAGVLGKMLDRLEEIMDDVGRMGDDFWRDQYGRMVAGKEQIQQAVRVLRESDRYGDDDRVKRLEFWVLSHLEK